MRAGKIILLVIGIIVLLISLGFVAGGAVLYGVNTTLTDSQGFISSKGVELTASSYAIATQDVNINVGTGIPVNVWGISPGDLVTVGITASSNSPTENVFIGIANEADAQTYLSNVQYHEISRLHFNPGGTPDVQYITHQGSVPANPVSQTFWVSSTYGTGTRTLEWAPQSGTYWIILMNEDASAGLDHTVSLAARVPLLSTIGLGLLALGIVGLIVGAIMLYFALRRSNEYTPMREIQ